MTTSSRNAGLRNMAKYDGEEETKAYVREHYGIDSSVTSWKDLDDIAERIEKDNAKAK